MIGLSIAPAVYGIAQNTAPNLEKDLQLIFLVGEVQVGNTAVTQAVLGMEV